MSGSTHRLLSAGQERLMGGVRDEGRKQKEKEVQHINKKRKTRSCISCQGNRKITGRPSKKPFIFCDTRDTRTAYLSNLLVLWKTAGKRSCMTV